MSYIAFLDMLGTRAKVSLGNSDYTNAVNIFNEKLLIYSDIYNGKVYGYSDNAYVQFDNLDKMINFLRELRSSLMLEHYYFCAAVEEGTLSHYSEPLVSKGIYHSMKFTSDAAVKVYRLQSQCTGIGVFLSNSLSKRFEAKCNNSICRSVCLKNDIIDGEFALIPVYDINYQGISISILELILSDYLITAAINPRAGRYYISAVISMIKSVELSYLQNDDLLHQMIRVLSFQDIPKCFQNIVHNKAYKLYFLFALLDRVLSAIDPDSYSDINAWKICETIIREFGIEHDELIMKLPKMPSSIILDRNKQAFLTILFDIN